ncbi:MAG: hypothetical protein KDC73_03310 [Ignavibacteriae bacterium]|nr:hypothetical protein [Ignavibacteriota bacterium]MCB9244251.1 hypothetical protein [Ignavibacteriales bacterium]
MRKILLILILIFSNSVYSQRLEGKWQEHPDNILYSELYKFTKDGKFSYSYSNDIMYLQYGEGDYEIKNGKLFLFFRDFPMQEPSQDSVSKIIITDTLYSSDSIVYNLKLIDSWDKSSLEGGIIWLSDSRSRSLVDPISGQKLSFQSDKLGKVRIAFPKRISPYYICAAYVGYDIFRFKSLDSAGVEAVIELREERAAFTLDPIPSGEVRIYQIEIDDINDYIYLREKSLNNWDKYKKIYK